MKNLLLTTIILSLAIATSFGQETTKPVGGYFTGSGSDNWFISIGGGAQVYFGNDDKLYLSTGNIAPAIDFSFGRWVAPSLGFRVGLSGLEGRGWSVNDTPYAYKEVNGLFKEKFYYANARVDLLWSVLDMGNNYKYSRVFKIIPFVGMGAVSTFYPGVDGIELGISGTAGFLFNFRLARVLSLNFELRSTMSHGEMDKVGYNKEPSKINMNNIEFMNAATLGFQFEINPKGFERRSRVEQGYKSDIGALLNALAENEAKNKLLNDKNVELNERCYQMIKDNELLLEVSGLSDTEVEVIEEIVPVKETPKAQIEVAVFFASGSSALTDKDKINLKYLCATIKSTGEDFSVTPYADNSTGSRSINIAIAKKRGQAVLDYLLECGVKRSKLDLKVNEFNIVPFNIPSLNRCVIIRSEK